MKEISLLLNLHFTANMYKSMYINIMKTLMERNKIIHDILRLWGKVLEITDEKLYINLQTKSHPLNLNKIHKIISEQAPCNTDWIEGLNVVKYYKFMKGVITICHRNMIPPGSPALLYHSLCYTAKAVQDALDKRKQQRKEGKSSSVATDTVAEEKWKNVFIVITKQKNLVKLGLPKNTKLIITGKRSGIIQQCGNITNNSSLIKYLILRGIFIKQILLPTGKSSMTMATSLYFNEKNSRKKCKTFCGNKSYLHFIEKHAINDYKCSLFPTIVITRVGLAKNEDRSPISQASFESPSTNYQREAVRKKQNYLSDTCSCLMFSKCLPIGTAYETGIKIKSLYCE
jgi:hypothetical protein